MLWPWNTYALLENKNEVLSSNLLIWISLTEFQHKKLLRAIESIDTPYQTVYMLLDVI